MRLNTISRVAKILAIFWAKKDAPSEWTKESLKTYVEAIKTARTVSMGLLLGFVGLQLLTLVFIGLWHGLSTIQPWSPETWAWIEIGVCGGILVLLIAGISLLMSERFWINLFKIDEAISSLEKDVESTTGGVSSARKRPHLRTVSHGK